MRLYFFFCAAAVALSCQICLGSLNFCASDTAAETSNLNAMAAVPNYRSRTSTVYESQSRWLADVDY